MKTFLFLAFFCLLFLPGYNGYSQQKWNSEVPKQIIIIKSSKNYEEALATARDAAKRLNKKLDLRGLRPDPKIGLTMSESDCHGTGGSDDLGYPCYQARGDGNAENDDYISVEYSNVYKGMTKGFYIVVAGITDISGAAAEKQLAQVKQVFSDAYGKRTMIWYGSMN